MAGLTPTSQTQNAQFRKVHWALFSSWPLMLVVILLIASLSYFAGWSARGMVDGQAPSTQVPGAQSSPSNQLQPAASPLVEPLSRSFENKNFSFRYPSTWSLDSINGVAPNDSEVRITTSRPTSKAGGGDFTPGFGSIEVLFGTQETLGYFPEKIETDKKYSKVLVGAHTGYQTENYGGVAGSVYARITYVDFPNIGVFKIVLETQDEEYKGQFVSEYDQMLSTFKFAQSELNYELKRFNPTDYFLGKQPYPTVLKNLSDAQLVPMQCSYNYDDSSFGEGTPVFKYTDGNNSIELSDPQLLAFIKSKNALLAQQTNPKKISRISRCLTQSGDSIIHYEIWAGGGGVGNASYFSYTMNGHSGEISITNEDGLPYFSCSDPLALTKNGILYYGCGGGDGGFGGKSAYELNLNNQTARKIIICTSSANGDGTGTTENCQ